jgi:predicted exporter
MPGCTPCRDFFYKSSNPTVGIILLLLWVFTMSCVLLNCLIGEGPLACLAHPGLAAALFPQSMSLPASVTG